MKIFFNLYIIIMSVIVFPAAYFLWLHFFNGNFLFVNYVFLVPLLFAYINSGTGTNYLKLWEFRSSFRIGRLPVLHGFMFTGASALLLFTAVDSSITGFSLLRIIKTGLSGCAIIGFANWLFDILMIKKGFAVIYNKYFYENMPAAAIVTDYAPLYFGTFGLCYGISAELGKSIIIYGNNQTLSMIYMIISVFLCLFLPVAAHVISSMMRHGYSGLRPYRKNSK